MGRTGAVVCCVDPGRFREGRHEEVTCAGIAARLAALLNVPYAGLEAEGPAEGRDGLYLVPRDTLLESEWRGGGEGPDERRIFGGVAPHAFVATKAITHPLLSRDAPAPAGWAYGLGERMREHVLEGWTVFSRQDAREAAERLLRRGPVRVKDVCARGGHGQIVIGALAELEARLDAIEPASLGRDGLVLEENLAAEVTTLSVGQVRVAGLVASYVGTQRLTADNEGRTVYGGSDLTVVRGDFDALLASDVARSLQAPIAQARAYDAAAAEHFPALVASRRNYDVIQGRDAAGAWRSGVLEQSWRLGGASGAEIAALERFRADPSLRAVQASTVELFGSRIAAPPPGAAIYYDGVDPVAGRLLKYATIGPA